MGANGSPPAAPSDVPDARGFWQTYAPTTTGQQQTANSSSATPARIASTTFVSAARRTLAAYRPLPLNVLRVSQLDAELLDVELTSIVKEQLMSVFALFKTNVNERYEPELTALLQYIMCHLSIYARGASYGLELQNLKYRNETRHASGRLETLASDAPLSKWQKIAHAVLFIGGRWGWLRANRHATANEWSEESHDGWKHRAWRWMQKIETGYRVLSLLNFLAFLYNGRYRSLLDRVLRMRLVYARREMSRQVSFEFMNRQLVWHAFTEFLLFLVPLINVQHVKNTISRAISGPETVDLPEHICAICHAEDQQKPTIHTPYVTNCGHVYCYYCIK
ncbi:peroxisome assembly protein (Peroxin-2) [Thoreauomyces humboldtii]|nr:peroxisome assembly protein (Peroxin-2) [Thoreauomyces humboldtii]